VKVKDLKYAQEEEVEGPLQVARPAVNCESDVNCAFIILVDISRRYSGLYRSVCQTVCLQEATALW